MRGRGGCGRVGGKAAWDTGGGDNREVARERLLVILLSDPCDQNFRKNQQEFSRARSYPGFKL